MVPDMVKWSRLNFDSSQMKATYAAGRSELMVYNLQRRDAGVFTCTADNYLDQAATAEAQVVVKCK